MMATARVPADQASSQVSISAVLAQHPSAALVRPSSKHLHSPTRHVAEHVIDRVGAQSRKEVGIGEHILRRRTLVHAALQSGAIFMYGSANSMICSKAGAATSPP